MSSVAKILRRLSGDKSQKSEVASDAIVMAEQGTENSEQGNSPVVDSVERSLNPDGGATPESNVLTKNAVKQAEKKAEKVSENAENCTECAAPFNTQRPSGKITCCRCLESFCYPCLNLKKTESAPILKRADFHWSCNKCTHFVYEMFKEHFDRLGGGSAPAKPKTEVELVASLLPEITKKMIDPIRAEIRAEVQQSVEKCITEKVPEVIDHSVNASISKTWAAVAGDFSSVEGAESSDSGDPETDFSIILSKKQKKAAAAQIQAIKEVTTQQRIDEGSRDERMKNVILFRVPESNAETQEDKQKDDEEFVKGLLKAIKVNDDEPTAGSMCPKKVYRLGKLGATRNPNTSRPIKIEFKSKTDQNLVMNNAKNLKNAEDKFKNVNINYDLSETDRQELTSLLTTAKDKTKNSTEFIWKVRGPPGKMAIVRYTKRTPHQ